MRPRHHHRPAQRPRGSLRSARAAAVLGLALAVSAPAGCGSGPGKAAGPAARKSTRPATTTAQAGGASHGLGGHGELAFVAHGGLFLTGGPAGALRRVRLPGVPDSPVWSADHRWLAVRVAKPPPAGSPYLTEPAGLWVLGPAGTGARRLTPLSWDVASFAWSPRSDRLAVAADMLASKDISYAAAVVTTGGARRVLDTGSYVSGVAWSPDGHLIASGVYAGTPRRGTLDLLSPAGGTPTVVTSSKFDVLELAGWWPAGSGLLYWTDTGGSASLAADGLPLGTVSLAGHRPRQLTRMLVHGSWLAFSPDGSTVAAVSGDDREIWYGHKGITRCRPTGNCTPVAQPSGVVSLDPSWSPDGKRLVFARASASGSFGPKGHADFSRYWIRRWQATSRLWVAGAAGSGARPLAAAGAGAVDPVWGSDGSLLFVRDDSIWLLPSGAASPVKVAGPLGALTGPAYYQTYYGYVPYPALIAWTLARPSGAAGSGA
jgi:Tol biopolymer transport system component